MIIQREKKDLSILVENLHMLPEVVPNKKLLECIYLDMVLDNRENFVVDLPFDLKNASKLKSAKHLRAFFSQLEKVFDAAERVHLISEIDGRQVTPYMLVVHKCKKGFSYTLKYFDGRMNCREYTQEEIWRHPRLMRCYSPEQDE